MGWVKDLPSTPGAPARHSELAHVILQRASRAAEYDGSLRDPPASCRERVDDESLRIRQRTSWRREQRERLRALYVVKCGEHATHHVHYDLHFVGHHDGKCAPFDARFQCGNRRPLAMSLACSHVSYISQSIKRNHCLS